MLLVSVIIPVYNISNYLSKCLSTVLKQTYQNMEILLIDDGSTDDSLKICEDLAMTDNRIRVIHQENEGVSSARNKGIENSAGDYIAFIDGDDIIAPFYIERLINAIDGKLLSGCMSSQISGEEGILSTEKNETFLELSSEECAKRLITGRFPVSVWGCIFCKKNIGDLRFPIGIRYNEDKHFLFKYLMENRDEKIAFTNQRMYGHYVRAGSATSRFWDGLKDIVWVADDIHEYVLNKYPEWEDLSQQNRITTRFTLLKAVTKREDNKAFKEIREDILRLELPANAGIQTKIEYFALRVGLYQLLLNIYCNLMSDQDRIRRNEKHTRQT